MDITYSPDQEQAISLCCDLSHRIACVTGQAGTGKTTILKDVYNALLEVYNEDEEAIVLAAPTGRAAKRIEEVTGITAMTIHRLLKYTMPEDDNDVGLPRHGKNNPLPHSVVIVDEASMIDQELWRGLISSLKNTAIIRFFGDINQLPPISFNNKSPFAHALANFPSQTLLHNYRSDDGIIAASDRIINGSMPITNKQVQMFFIKNTETMYHIRNLCDSIDFTKTESQIIVPTQRTKYGCNPINVFIQQRYNPAKEKIQTYQKDINDDVLIQSFKIGDKVLWTKNDYTVGIMNGSIGKVQAIDHEGGTITVDFGGNYKEIPPQVRTYDPITGKPFTYDPRNRLTLGYAITTHKAQGSQFDTVLYVVSRSRAATRQNAYTAVTRAINKLIIIGISGALMTAVNTKVAAR